MNDAAESNTPEPKSSTKPRLRKGTGKPQFLYRQLADLLSKDIQAGVFKPGDMLPSMDELARRYEINKATVRQAISELITEGAIYSIPAKGTFVSDPSPTRRNSTRPLTIGWISSIEDHGLTGSYHMEMMQSARKSVQALGGHFLVFSTEGLSSNAFWKTLGEARLDGALLIGPSQEDPLKQILNGRLPSVVINDKARGHRVNSVQNDNEGGGYQAVRHLLELGHRDLAFVTGPRDWRVTRERLTGAEDALREADIPIESVITVESDFSPKGGMDAIGYILDQVNKPTGIFFFNDEMASGALLFLNGNTPYRVPKHFSFVGFDDISWTSMTHPPLTTVHVETELMGRKAVELLKKIIDGGEHVPLTTVVPTRLVARKSTAPVTLTVFE
jgi:LacI family transcriptional regulator